ncbi:gonadotropin-releasing hormone receptor-like [Trichomycterus rosablanca]|uniref:gonadotropin-releasing hormone receptor-like n=1 Tax=Trichomycterus rosablanca TaxID=2290929 RepID=UPI002F35ADCB
MKAEDWMRTVIRIIICLCGIIGNNWLALSSLPKSISQLRTNDMLFVNLAVSNLITNFFVDIPDIMDFVNRFPDGRSYCSAFSFCSELSESSSIITTMFITVYWHQKLVGSLKHGGAPVPMDNIRHAAAMLAGSWTIAFVFNIPHLFFVSNEHNSENHTLHKECSEKYPSPEVKQAYEILYVIIVNLIPMIGILTASIQITSTLLQNEKRMKANNKTDVKNASAEDPKPQQGSTGAVEPKSHSKSSSSSGSLVRAAKSVLAVATIFLICWVIHIIVTVISTFKDTVLLMEMASYIGALYTNFIPYIYLHGVKKFACCCTDRG